MIFGTHRIIDTDDRLSVVIFATIGRTLYQKKSEIHRIVTLGEHPRKSHTGSPDIELRQRTQTLVPARRGRYEPFTIDE